MKTSTLAPHKERAMPKHVTKEKRSTTKDNTKKRRNAKAGKSTKKGAKKRAGRGRAKVDIRVGDCCSLMPTFDADSFDAIVTDPPYHLLTGKKNGKKKGKKSAGFMGKAWDGGDVAFRPETWAEALRIAKPGAHLAAFGGTRTFHRLTCAIEDAGWEIRDCLSWLYGTGFPKSHNGAWGGTALKPAWEPIILARKPLIGTVNATHAKHGTGGLNIDGCRIGTRADAPQRFSAYNSGIGHGYACYGTRSAPAVTYTEGRWPANLCLDKQAAAALDEQSEGIKGGASRFFYTAKASSKERNAGLDNFPLRQRDETCDPDQLGYDNPYNRGSVAVANMHPTVKPLALMKWICRLVTPKGGRILDPFVGSGSTGLAAFAEGFRFVGIEQDDEYAALARARMRAMRALLTAGR